MGAWATAGGRTLKRMTTPSPCPVHCGAMKGPSSMLAAALLLSACSPKAQPDQGEAGAAPRTLSAAPARASGELVTDFRGLPVGIVLSALTDLTPVDNGHCVDVAERSAGVLGADITVSEVRAWSFSDRIVPALAAMNRAAAKGGITDFEGWSGDLELAQEVESTGDYSLTSMAGNGYLQFTNQTLSIDHVNDFWVLMREAEPHKIVCTWKRSLAPTNQTDYLGGDESAGDPMDLERQE